MTPRILPSSKTDEVSINIDKLSAAIQSAVAESSHRLVQETRQDTGGAAKIETARRVVIQFGIGDVGNYQPSGTFAHVISVFDEGKAVTKLSEQIQIMRQDAALLAEEARIMKENSDERAEKANERAKKASDRLSKLVENLDQRAEEDERAEKANSGH